MDISIESIRELYQNMNICEKREETRDYCEVVFFSKETQRWEQVFTDIFGQIKKQPGVKPTKDDLRVTDDFGGICKNQTLFEKDCENFKIIVMFWPWQDGEHTTLKIASINK